MMSATLQVDAAPASGRFGFQPAVKVVAVYVLFILIYGIYRFFPVFPLSIIAGANESNFQHYKAIFFALLIVDLVEFAVCHKRLVGRTEFWNARLLAAVLAPWVVFLLWYIAPALFGKFSHVAMEIVWANAVTVVAVICTVTLEGSFSSLRPTRGLTIVVWSLALVSILLYMVFTFSHLPWADVFVEPQWR